MLRDDIGKLAAILVVDQLGHRLAHSHIQNNSIYLLTTFTETVHPPGLYLNLSHHK